MATQNESSSRNVLRSTVRSGHKVSAENSKNQVSMSGQRYEYDVFFLSHEDTRYGFTGNLWKGVNDRGFHTFMVDEALGNEEISPSFVKEIEQSKIVMVVLSKNYAFSSFCLDELSEILDCIKDRGRLVWPVYYNVDPSDVRRQIGAFGDAFQRWEEKYKDNMEKVQNWRKALIRVSTLPGWDCRPDRNQYEFEYVHKIVEAVSKKLDRFPLRNTDYLVGIDFQLENVLSLMELESKSDGALMVGIHGIGGVGKTTLAQEIYNMIAHQFDASCFLPDVTQKSSENGLLHLQNMLLSEMIGEKNSSFKTVDRGALMIKNTLHRMKVLLILDDMDALEPLEALAGKPDWFGPGSRVIFTTQDKHLLAFHGVERIYTVRPLNHTDSLELLSHQVFKQGVVDSSLAEIFNEMVSYTSGLPLALKVIGSSLCGQTVEQWTDVLHQLKRIPSNGIQKILKTCFNALGKEEKSIFLDIACCFQGYKLVEALDILCAHRGDDVKLHINVLKDKSFVSNSSDGMVTLHPLIEGMGKDIVRQEYPNEPGKRSRLWFHGDIIEVLKNNTGSSKIEIIHLDSPLIEDEEAIEWSGDAFKKMKNLKTLIIRKGRFSKAPKYLPDSLKVLEWWRYPSENLPYDFNPNQLVIHKLPNKGIMSPMSVELTEASPSGSQVPHTSPNVPQTLSSQVTQNNSQSFPLASQNSQIDSGVFQVLEGGYEDPKPITPAQTSSIDFKSNIWRIIGLMSSVVGLSCFAVSPSFNRLIRGWNAWKFILYVVICLSVLLVFLFIKQSSPSVGRVGRVGRVWYKIQGFFIMMLIAVYTFYYNKTVDGKPEILCLVSNAAFVLMSLSYSKLRKLAYEMGVFSFFLSCLTVQLWTINWKLIWIPICFGFPLFYLHSSSDPGKIKLS